MLVPCLVRGSLGDGQVPRLGHRLARRLPGHGRRPGAAEHGAGHRIRLEDVLHRGRQGARRRSRAGRAGVHRRAASSRGAARRWCGSRTARRGCRRDDQASAGRGVGLFEYLVARGDRWRANPVPRGLSTRSAEPRRVRGVPLVRGAAHVAADASSRTRSTRCWRRCARIGIGRWCRRCCWAGCAAARCSGCGCATCGWARGGCSSPRARAAISGWCRSRRGSSPPWPPIWTRNGPRTSSTDRVFVVLKGPSRGGR